jgi:hypothetical protein
MPGGTGCCAASATDTKIYRWFVGMQVNGDTFVVPIEVDRFIAKDAVSEFFRHDPVL